MSTTTRNASETQGREERSASSITMRPLRLLEIVAERGGATAYELRDGLGCSLPTVYRLAQSLVEAGYLVHITSESRFELGYALNPLGVALHQQVGTSPAMRRIVNELHRSGEVAAYYAVYRGADAVVAYVSDSPEHPRIGPLRFGFHEAIHATAFGKIILAGDAGVATRALTIVQVVLIVAALGVAIGSGILIFKIGDSGARAVWEGVGG